MVSVAVSSGWIRILGTKHNLVASTCRTKAQHIFSPDFRRNVGSPPCASSLCRSYFMPSFLPCSSKESDSLIRRALVSSRFATAIHPVNCLWYEGANWSKNVFAFLLLVNASCNAFGIPDGILGRLDISQSPDFLASATLAAPAFVITPPLCSLATRFLFNADHRLLGLRGVIFRAYLSSSILLMMLSIQPKHRASSTAASYSSETLPVCFLQKTSQIPLLLSWCRLSQSLHCFRVVTYTCFMVSRFVLFLPQIFRGHTSSTSPADSIPSQNVPPQHNPPYSLTGLSPEPWSNRGGSKGQNRHRSSSVKDCERKESNLHVLKDTRT